MTDRAFEFRPGEQDLGVVDGWRSNARELPASAYSPGTGASAGAPVSLLAWDPGAQEARWRVLYGLGGTLTTAGNLVFQATLDGLAAYRADTGEKRWEVALGGGIMAPPSTYALDGRQYVSVLAGWGGSGGLNAGINPPSGQYKAEGRLWTFTLDGDLPVEPVRGRERPPLSVIAYSATPDRIADGGDLYARFCQRCHGPNAASGGAISDLRYAAPATFDRFDDIVRGGAYVPLGMPAFDWFGDDDLDALRSYVLSRREALMSAAGD